MNGIDVSGKSLYIVTGEQLNTFAQQCAETAVQRAEMAWKRQHDEMFDPVFTKQHVADIFDVNVRTIDNWIDSGIIDPTKIGSVVRIDGNEIVRLKQDYKRKHLSTH